jgi:hypothetical protein
VGFYSLFALLDGKRCLSNANRHFLGRRSVSLTTYCPFGTSPQCVLQSFITKDIFQLVL